jgi:hypothetical protein
MIRTLYFFFLSLVFMNNAFGQSMNVRYGVGASFGARISKVHSTIPDLMGMKVYQEGGSLEAFLERGAINARIHLGYFSSGSSVKHNIDLFESGLSASFHPMLLQGNRKRRISPYVVSVLAAERNQFYGFYGHNDPGHINYSSESAPYVGNVSAVSISAGLGMQYRLVNEHEYLVFFAELHQPVDLREQGTGILTATSVHDGMSFNIGLAFGF